MDDTGIRMLQLAAKGYSCSQIMILLALEMQTVENPSLVRAMGGLAYGCGSGRATCGVLTGGCCLLALYAGKGSDSEPASDRLPLMLDALSQWFESNVGHEFGGTICESITGEKGPANARRRCGKIVGDTFAKVMEILMEYGIDPISAP